MISRIRLLTLIFSVAVSTREQRTRGPPNYYEAGPASGHELDPTCFTYVYKKNRDGSPAKKKPRKAKKEEVAANPEPTRVDPEECTEQKTSTILSAGQGLFATKNLDANTDLGSYSLNFVCGDEALEIIGDGKKGKLDTDFVECMVQPPWIEEEVEGPWLLKTGECLLRYVNAAPPRVEPNIGITPDGRFVTLKPIEAGEEMLTYYGDSYWKDVAAHSAKKPVAERGQCIYPISNMEPPPQHVALQTADETLMAATQEVKLAGEAVAAATEEVKLAADAVATEEVKLAAQAVAAAKLAMEAHKINAITLSGNMYGVYDQPVGIFLSRFRRDEEHQAEKNTRLLMSELGISDDAPVYVIAADPGQDSFAGGIESGTQSVVVYFHRGSSLYIVYIHVPDTQRGQGDGRELVQLLRDQATEYGATQLKVTLQTCVRDAGGFFEKCGFESAQACHGAVSKNDHRTRDELTLHLIEGRSLRN